MTNINLTDVLIVVPPFSNVVMPSLAAHIVHDTLINGGVDANIYYANLVAARRIGFNLYHTLAESNRGLVCERLGSLALAKRNHPNVATSSFESEKKLASDINVVVSNGKFDIEDWTLKSLIESIDDVVEEVCQKILSTSCHIVAFTSTFQTITLIELISNHLKSIALNTPHIVVGGSNTEGEMAEGFMSFSKHIDHFFSGGVNQEFVKYCKFPDMWSRGVTTSKDLSQPYSHLLDFSAFFIQAKSCNHPRYDQIWLPMETSKGCWFGEKSHCTFCGLNGDSINYRGKTSDQALKEYIHYRDRYNPAGFFMVDNIIPRSFFNGFLRQISKFEQKPNIFYEVKSNLSFEEILLLRESGSTAFQPGIEGLSTPLLKHMKKGTSAFINLRTLFWAKQIGIKVFWNLLARFPNDSMDWYVDTLTLLPFIRHLNPPQQVVSKVSLDRFSPLYEQAKDNNISNIRPNQLYNYVFGGNTNLSKLAYHFEGDFDSAYSEKLDKDFESIILSWIDSWSFKPPSLEAFDLDGTSLLIVDTRRSINSEVMLIDKQGALMKFLTNGVNGLSTEEMDWLIEKGLVLKVENHVVNLVERLNKDRQSVLLPYTPDKDINLDERLRVAKLDFSNTNSLLQ